MHFLAGLLTPQPQNMTVGKVVRAGEVLSCCAAHCLLPCDWGFPGGEVLVHVHFTETVHFFFISVLGIYHEETLDKSVKVYMQGCCL